MWNNRRTGCTRKVRPAGRDPPATGAVPCPKASARSEEHTSELQSLMRISYAVFCLKKKTKHPNDTTQKHKLQYPNNTNCIHYASSDESTYTTYNMVNQLQLIHKTPRQIV